MRFVPNNKSSKIFLLVGALILILLFRSFGFEKIIIHVKDLGWKFLIIISLFLFNNIFLTLAWKIIINFPLKARDFPKLVFARIAGDSTALLNSIGAIAGEPIKAMYMKDTIPFNTGLASVVFDRTIHTIANSLLILTGIISSFFIFNIPLLVSTVSLIIILLFLGLLIIILLKQRHGFIEYLLSKFPGRIVKKVMNDNRWESVKALDKEIGFILSTPDNLKRFYLSLSIRYISILTVGILEVYLIINFIGTNISLSGSMFVYVFTLFMTGIIFFMPANLGTSEGSFSLALQFIGLDPALGLTLGIIQRLRRFVWSGFGMIILFYAGLIKKEMPNEKRTNS